MVEIFDSLDEPLAALLQAAADPWGAEFHTDNVDVFKSRLYKARQKHGEDHPEILDLTIKTSPHNPEFVWIVKSNLKEALAAYKENSLDGENPQDSPSGNTLLDGRREANLQDTGHSPKGDDP